MPRRKNSDGIPEIQDIFQPIIKDDQRATVQVRIFGETKQLIMDAIHNEAVKNSSGIPAKHVNEVIEIAVAKLLDIKLPSIIDKQLLIDYGFDNQEQLGLYYRCLKEIPAGVLSLEGKKALRAAIKENRFEQFVASLQASKPVNTGAPEEF